jgi:pimeloyl-ACP methyl ester carboxylesterase
MNLSVCYLSEDVLEANQLISFLRTRRHHVCNPFQMMRGRDLNAVLRECIIESEVTILIYGRAWHETVLGHELTKVVMTYRDRLPSSVVIFGLDDTPIPVSLRGAGYVPRQPVFEDQAQRLDSLLEGLGRRPPHSAISDAVRSVAVPTRRSENYDHLVLLVHGINTYAHWFDKVQPALESVGFLVVPVSYGHYSVSNFLSGSKKHLEQATARLMRSCESAKARIRNERDVQDPKVSIIAHSFGTYLCAEFIQDHPGLRWHRLIFCGSIVGDEFRFDKIADYFKYPLINEVGTKDYWPAFAAAVNRRYGSSGSTGLHDAYVITRWHKGHAHNTFLTPEFCRENWIPFLVGKKPQKIGEPASLPRWVTIISFLLRRRLAVAMATVFVAALSAYLLLWR